MSNIIYCIAYINRKYIHQLPNDLAKTKLDIKVNIPIVNILAKKFKGKELYESVPLMLNYGFVGIRDGKQNNPEYLKKISRQINCIAGFLKDKNGKNYSVATASFREIKRVERMGKKMSIYSGMDFNSDEGREKIRMAYEPHIDSKGNYVEGKLVRLKGYPFDEVDARIVKIKFAKQEVDVLLHISIGTNTVARPATISFNNLFYSIYDEEEESEMQERYIEDLATRGSIESLIDTLNYNNNLYEEE